MRINWKGSERILVTGGAGFIGSALIWGLNRQGLDRIVVVDRLGSDDKWKNLTPLGFEDYVEADDLFDRLESKALGDFDVVLHMGACSSTLERDVSYLAANNFEYTKRLALWSLGNGARFVYASSAATYGDGTAGMSDSHDPTDLAKLRPLNPYGWSKHLFDRYAQSHGLLDRIAGLKYFNVFGPNEYHKAEMRSVVHKAYEQVRDTGRVKLFRSYRPDYADGEQKRDFVYVKDVVDMTLHLARNSDANGLFNIGSGEAHTWLELTHALFSAMNRRPEIEFVDMPEEMRGRYQYFTRADISRLNATGYPTTPTSLESAVADYVRTYLEPGRHLGD